MLEPWPLHLISSKKSYTKAVMIKKKNTTFLCCSSLKLPFQIINNFWTQITSQIKYTVIQHTSQTTNTLRKVKQFCLSFFCYRTLRLIWLARWVSPSFLTTPCASSWMLCTWRGQPSLMEEDHPSIKGILLALLSWKNLQTSSHFLLYSFPYTTLITVTHSILKTHLF